MVNALKRNNTIDLMRFVCAILVVAIHTHPFYDISEWAGVFGTLILPRIAVPFFLCVSGYFFIKKLNENSENCFKPIIKVVKIYAIWSVPYVVLNVLSDIMDGEPIVQIVNNCLTDFFIKGSYYHFWYFPALIISMLIVVAFYKLKKQRLMFYISIALYIIGCVLRTYYHFVQNLPGVKEFCNSELFVPLRSIFMMAFPFFASGYLLNLLMEKVEIKEKFIGRFVFFLWIVFFVEIIAIYKTKIFFNDITVTFTLYPLVIGMVLLLLNNPMGENAVMSKWAVYSRKLANFIFYVHPLVKLLLTKSFEVVFEIKLEYTYLFILTLFTTLFMGIIICKLNIRLINRFLV